MKRVLIAGCGYVGRELGRRLADEGAEVFGLRRGADELGPGIRPVRADLSDPKTLDGLPAELDGVVYAASAGSSTPDAYRAAYVTGLRNLLSRVTPRRLIFLSSTAVYGDRHGAWTDETTSTEPDHFSGEILLEAERLALSAPCAAVVLRLGGIYGPGRDRLVRAVASGEARRPAEPTWTNRIHRDDAAGAAAHLLSIERPESVYLGVDSEPADLGTMYAWIASRLGCPAPAVAEAPAEGRLARGSKRCSNARLLGSGYSFAYPTFREGYAPLIP